MRVWGVSLAVLLLSLSTIQPSSASGPDDYWSSAFAPPGASSEVFAFAELDGALIAGDERWTGSGWERLGDGLDGPVYALTMFDGALVAVGDFHTSGDVAVGHVARWNRATWEPLGSLANPTRALAVYDGQLYAGAFRWDGATWTNVLQTDGAVNALELHAGLLIVGGTFHTAGGLATPALVGWDGSSLVPLGHRYEVWSGVSDLVVHDGQLVAIGGFRDGTDPSPAIVTWDGTTWTTLLRWQYPDPSWTCLASRNGLLYAGGCEGLSIEGPCGVSIGIWNGSQWQYRGNGYGDVNTLFPTEAGLAVGGAFANLWSCVSLNAALWTDTGFVPLASPGQGASDEVRLLTVEGDHLIAAGAFDAAGPATAYRYEQWDGAAWSPTCFTIPEAAYPATLAIGGGLLITSGQYQWLGNYCRLIAQCQIFPLDLNAAASKIVFRANAFYFITYNQVRRLDGLSLTTLGGSAAGGSILTAAASASDLLAGGDFDAIGSIAAKGVARWDGTAWQPFGTGLEGSVAALTEHAGAIHAGGSIDVSGGTPAQRVMRWDGANWLPQGDTFDGAVTCLTSCAGDLYAGGLFQNVGAQPASRIARWDGANWTPLGSGVDGDVLVMQPFHDALYLGGRFHYAGGKPSAHFAAWSASSVGVELQDFVASRSGAGAIVSWEMTGAGPEDSYRLLRADPSESLIASGAWNTSGSERYAVDDPQAPTTACDYWLEYVGPYDNVRRYGPAHLEAATPPSLALALHANVPNPFNPSTTFAFTLPRAAAVRLSIYDARGRLIVRPVDGALPAGGHQAVWDGRDRSGAEAPSGSYLARLETPQGIRARKVQLVR